MLYASIYFKELTDWVFIKADAITPHTPEVAAGTMLQNMEEPKIIGSPLKRWHGLDEGQYWGYSTTSSDTCLSNIVNGPNGANTISIEESVSPADLEKNAKVLKIGRTTGITHGRIVGYRFDVSLDASFGSYSHFGAWTAVSSSDLYPAFSGKGDSGSLIYTEDFKAVGLLYGGAQMDYNGLMADLTFFSPMPEVLDRLDVRLPSAAEWEALLVASAREDQ